MSGIRQGSLIISDFPVKIKELPAYILKNAVQSTFFVAKWRISSFLVKFKAFHLLKK